MAIVSFFHCDPQTIRTKVGIGTRLRAYGCRTLELLCGRNPKWDANEDAFVTNFEKTLGKEIDWCIQYGWTFVARLDDWFRLPAERVDMQRWDGFAPKYLAARLAACRRCIGVEVCDEVGQNPADYPLALFSDWWYGQGGPPLAYPGLATQAFEAQAGAISRQWPWWAAQNWTDRETWIRGCLNGVPDDSRSVTVDIPVVGPFYEKRVHGGSYQHGYDKLWNRGAQAEGIVRMMDLAMQLVNPLRLRMRLYALDTFWKKQRMDTPVGSTTRLQTGTDLSDPRWPEIELAIQRASRGVLLGV